MFAFYLQTEEMDFRSLSMGPYTELVLGFIPNIIIMCMCICGVCMGGEHVCATACVQRSEDNF